MKIKETKVQQSKRLNEICLEKGVGYDSLNILLDSVKTKRLKRNNYHQQKINDIIEKAIK